MPRSISISSRSTRRCGRCRARRSPPSPALARALRRRARRPDAAGRQRILRRPAGAPVREDGARLGERMVGLARRRRDAASGAGARRHAVTPRCLPDAAAGAQAETLRSRAAPLAAAIGARLRRDGGWALIVDYGYDHSGHGASLQAVRGHRGAAILDRPGETDLSAHVDFAALRRGDRRADLRTGRPGRFPAPAGHHAACRDIESARQRGPARAPSTRRWRA